jgi:hypothetical protein
MVSIRLSPGNIAKLKGLAYVRNTSVSRIARDIIDACPPADQTLIATTLHQASQRQIEATEDMFEIFHSGSPEDPHNPEIYEITTGPDEDPSPTATDPA